MGCCGGSSRSTVQYQQTVNGGMVRVQLSDELEITGTFINVRGGATGSNYGGQIKGREFCVYRKDYDQAPHMFELIRETCAQG